MKNRTESSEIFDAYTEIDMGYLGLKMLYEEVSKEITSPINKLVDDATGLSKSKTEENKNMAISFLKSIIKAKKIIEVDYSKDEEMLNKLTK